MATGNRPRGGVSPGALRAIKIAVILMGLLIVGGMVVIVVSLISRASNLGSADDTAGPTGTAEAVEAVEAGEAVLELGPGDRIESASLNGDRMLLVVGRAGGGQDVLVVDGRTGALLLTLGGTPGAVAVDGGESGDQGSE
jgi:hypothetical protein